MSANRMTFIIYGNDFTRQILEGRHETMILDPTRLTRKDLYLVSAVALLVASLALLYWPVIIRLVYDWAHDDNYSHGFLIPPLAAYLVWERWDRLKTTPASSSAFGLVVIAGSIGVLLAGSLGAELFLSRIALVGALIGCVLYVLGWRHLKLLAFPLGVLLLMIPIPAIIFNQVVFPLQLVASQAGEVTLQAAGIPVLREGNVITLANTTLEVAEACSGIRSLSRCSPSRSCSVTLRIREGRFARLLR